MAQREGDDDGDDSIEMFDDNENNCQSLPPAKRMRLGKCAGFPREKNTLASSIEKIYVRS